MGIFGWSYPPGCSGTPYDETGSVALDIPGLPERSGAWWTEDGDVGVTEWDPAAVGEYDDGVRQRILGRLDWDDNLTEGENMAAAVAFARNRLGI
ncbi:MAG TPA: hypothetical protein VD864_14720 [Nocardioides sp.]|nr:hypothetical protein [Nocardioides sp.]